MCLSFLFFHFLVFGCFSCRLIHLRSVSRPSFFYILLFFNSEASVKGLFAVPLYIFLSCVLVSLQRNLFKHRQPIHERQGNSVLMAGRTSEAEVGSQGGRARGGGRGGERVGMGGSGRRGGRGQVVGGPRGACARCTRAMCGQGSRARPGRKFLKKIPSKKRAI